MTTSQGANRKQGTAEAKMIHVANAVCSTRNEAQLRVSVSPFCRQCRGTSYTASSPPRQRSFGRTYRGEVLLLPCGRIALQICCRSITVTCERGVRITIMRKRVMHAPRWAASRRALRVRCRRAGCNNSSVCATAAMLWKVGRWCVTRAFSYGPTA